MNKRFKIFSILVMLALVSIGCSVQVVQAQPRDQVSTAPAPYEALLGKSLTDQEVIDFIAMNECSTVGNLRMCHEIGLALGLTSNRVVETVFLYLEDIDGFTAYRGELPFRLKVNDTREAVETKLKEQRVGTGVANEEGLFDQTHCWATYYAAGLTVIYNSPSADDQDAMIHAILVSK
jgi:hypothetical protein